VNLYDHIITAHYLLSEKVKMGIFCPSDKVFILGVATGEPNIQVQN